MAAQDQDLRIVSPQPSPFGQMPSGGSSAGAAKILQRTQPWVRFLSIVGFVSVALMILVGVGAGAVGLVTQNAEMAVLLVVYPLLGLLYVFPALYLLRYSNRIRQFVAQGQQDMLEAALDAQRGFWKFIGVVTLVSLSLAALFLVIALVAGVVAAA